MLKADLHIHSNVSDGSVSIDGLVALAARKGLDAIAVTDHDTLSHIARLPRSEAVKVIGGIEISAMDKSTGVRAHILGYGIHNWNLIEALTQPLLEARHENTLRQIKILREHGYALDAEKMNKADGKYLYKQHVMEYLVRTGQVPEMFGEFYSTTFKNLGICAFDIEYIDVFEAVHTIRRAVGQAVLAHPGQQQNLYLIPALVECGLNGIEYNHPANGCMDRKVIQRLAENFGLYLTGGSDFHGVYEPHPVEMGAFISEESGVRAIC